MGPDPAFGSVQTDTYARAELIDFKETTQMEGFTHTDSAAGLGHKCVMHEPTICLFTVIYTVHSKLF